MKNKQPGNFVFKRKSVSISVIVGYANEDSFVESTSAYRQRSTNLYCKIQTRNSLQYLQMTINHATMPHIDEAASFPTPRLWYAQMPRPWIRSKKHNM
jgi:hypothetical protein